MVPDPSRLRDSTQIVLPCDELNGLREPLTDEFTVTVVVGENGYCRIIGSPVEIKAASGFLARHGISVPCPRTRRRSDRRSSDRPAGGPT